MQIMIFRGAIEDDNLEDRKLIHSLDKSLSIDMFFDVKTGSK